VTWSTIIPYLLHWKKASEKKKWLSQLKQYFNNIPVFTVPGSHDTYPFAQMAQLSSGYSSLFSFNLDIATFAKTLGWLKQAKNIKTHYGGYSVMVKDKLKIVALNSNFWYRWNFYNYWDVDELDSSGVFRFLANELIECEQQGTRAWIIAHIPPGGLIDEALPLASEVLARIMERFSPGVIAGSFFGHTHWDEFSVLCNSSSKTNDTAIGVSWIVPSVTPLSNYDPSWRYHRVDSNSFEIRDCYNYYTVLDETFQDGRPLRWQLEYSSRTEYDTYWEWPSTEPLNAKFWHSVPERILEDSSISQKYVSNGFRCLQIPLHVNLRSVGRKTTVTQPACQFLVVSNAEITTGFLLTKFLVVEECILCLNHFRDQMADNMTIDPHQLCNNF
jgi:sphingomyelin phosphodiesterase